MKRKSISRSIKKFLFFLIISITLLSCGSKEQIVYFQNIDTAGISNSIINYDAIIRADDLLTISVAALDQDAARPFNLPAFRISNATGQAREELQSYLVDTNGYIDFPVLGKLKLGGLNRVESTKLIKDMLKDYIKDPIVNIRIVNFKITVLGEVKNPGSYTIPNERITILEALGLAGDLTIKGVRDNVLVIRETDGKRVTTRVDLRSQEFFNSPMYYLVQNDVVYVEPNNSQIKASTVGPSTTETLRIISTLVTVAALIVSITRF